MVVFREVSGHSPQCGGKHGAVTVGCPGRRLEVYFMERAKHRVPGRVDSRQNWMWEPGEGHPDMGLWSVCTHGTLTPPVHYPTQSLEFFWPAPVPPGKRL